MTQKKVLLGFVLAGLGVSGPVLAADGFETFRQACTSGSHWYAGTHGGYNMLLSGYTGYTPMWIAGVDATYYIITEGRDDSGRPNCGDRTMVRLSLDYAPLNVPSGNYGLSEEYFIFDFSIIYRFGPAPSGTLKQWVPFVGGGFSIIWDKTHLETPATGSMSGTEAFLGFNASIGIYSPEIFGSIHLVPEAKMHGHTVPKGAATSVSIQIGLSYWPGESPLDKSRNRRRAEPK